MHHAEAGGKLVEILKNRVVDCRRARTAAEGKQRFFAVFPASFFTCGFEEFFAERRTRESAVFEFFCGFGEGSKHVAALFCHKSGGKPRRQIAFVREHGDFFFVRGKAERKRNESAFGKYKVGADFAQNFPRGAHRFYKFERDF